MPRTHLTAAALAAVALLSAGNSASAQEVRWRHDYAAARREATETGRCLLLDFGTESCFWCKKLDGGTFRDPKVVQALNERFIPVKIDAQREERITQAAGVESFPTLILATPEGKVVGRHAGYLDAPQFLALLNKAPAPTAAKPVGVAPPESEAERQRRLKEQLDADLAALHAKIAAGLER